MSALYGWIKGCMTKTRYRTESRAKAVAEASYIKRGVTLRHYYCNECLGFHLTKQLKEPSDGTKSRNINETDS